MKAVAFACIIAVASAACAEKDAKSCDADSACTWCKCAALPSQCWTLADAKKLPAGVYACDKSVEQKAPFRPPHLGQIERYDVMYNSNGTEYNATYFCDKSCQKFRYERFNKKLNHYEEIDVQNGQTKWDYDLKSPILKVPHCSTIQGPGLISCFVQQYADAVCEETTLGKETAYKCSKHFPATTTPIPSPAYDYIVWYTAAGKPLQVEDTSRSNIVDGRFTITKYSNTDAFPDTLFNNPDPSLCKDTLTANATAGITCKSATGGPMGPCPAGADSCCDGTPGVGQTCYTSSNQDCCTTGPGKGHVCAKGKCSTRPGFICD